MLRIKNLNKSYGTRTLFRDVSFSIEPNEKIGLMGRNGSGKSTFLRMLLDRNQYEEIDCAKTLLISSLEQNLNFTEDSLLAQVCRQLSRENKHEDWKAKSILMGLGFTEEDFKKAPKEFSSGFQVRIRLAEALVKDCHLLLLDEPTNYLDIPSLRWLKRFLKSWNNAFILVTHDRNFMEDVVTHTLAIHRSRMRKMKGGPQKIIDHIAMDEEVYERTRVKQEKKQKKTEEFISKFRAGARSAGLVQSRIKSLEKQKPVVKLKKIPEISFAFTYEDFFGNNLIKTERLVFGYDPAEPLINKLSLRINPGDKVAVIGKNGKGKSTLLKLLNHQLTPQSGQVKHHVNAQVASFGSDSKDALLPSRTIMEELRTISNTKEQQLRNLCGSLLFSGDDAKKHISKLSGGEKSRLCLGKTMLFPSQLLILDEPTNHLDMESCDALTKSLQEYKGAVVFVTHDENMISKLANRLVVFDNNTISIKEKNYQEFLKEDGWSNEEEEQTEEKKSSSNKEEYLQRKQLQKELTSLQNHQKKWIKKIDKLQTSFDSYTDHLTLAYEEKDAERIKDLGKEVKRLSDEIAKAYEEMEKLIDEESEKQKTLEQLQ